MDDELKELVIELIEVITSNVETSEDEHGNVILTVNVQYISEELELLSDKVGLDILELLKDI